MMFTQYVDAVLVGIDQERQAERPLPDGKQHQRRIERNGIERRNRHPNPVFRIRVSRRHHRNACWKPAQRGTKLILVDR